MPANILYLSGDITPEQAELINAHIYNGFTGTLIINSQGGDVYSALAIYDALRYSGKMNTAGTGVVGSAATLVLLGGQKRFASENTRFLIHPPVLLSNPSSSLERQEREFMHRLTAQLFARHTRLEEKEAHRFLSDQMFFGIERAEEIGLIEGLLKI